MSVDQTARKRPRRRAILGGRVFDDDGRGSDCMVGDLSVAGARVRCEDPFEGQSFLTLKIHKFNDIRRASVIWRKQGQIGLQFVREITNPPRAMQDFFKLLAEIERQNEAS